MDTRPDKKKKFGPRKDSRKTGPPARRGPPGDRRSPPEGLSGRVLEVRPQAWMPKGEALVEGRPPMTVWQGIPGEVARVRVEHEGRNQLVARWLDSADPHERRVEPRCERYSPCGGCPLMHLDPPGQERARRWLVRAALAHEGIEAEVTDFHPSPDGLDDFRHVVKLAVGRSDQGRLRVGAWGRRDRHVVPIPGCVVAAPVLRETMRAFAHHVIDLDIFPYEPSTERGVLRSAILRASRSTGEVLVTLVAGRSSRILGQLAERLAGSVSRVVGVWLHLNAEKGNAILARDLHGTVGVRPLLGKPFLEETLNGITYRIGPGDFFQTNPGMAEVLYARTLDRLELQQGVPVVDLYSGVGGLALPAAQRAGWALGVEEVEGAVLRARDAAARQQIPAEFLSERVEVALPEVVRRLEGTRPVVVVNPARRGLEPGVVEGLLALRPRRIAYISCNPRAMARDLALLQAGGFATGPIELFDMFPNTAHVECLAVLSSTEPVQDARRAPVRRVVR